MFKPITNPNDKAIFESSENFTSQTLTKREFFAAMAIVGVAGKFDSDDSEVISDSAIVAVRMADSLIASLNKEMKDLEDREEDEDEEEEEEDQTSYF